METALNKAEQGLVACEHLVHAEEQLRELLHVIHDHLASYDPDEDAYGTLLSVAHHVNEGLRELGYALDQAERSDPQGMGSEVGH